MKSAQSSKTALLIIDVQNGFLHPTHWGSSRSNPHCEMNIQRLLIASRKLNQQVLDEKSASHIAIVHIHHHSLLKDSMLHPGTKIEIGGRTIEATSPQDFVKPLPREQIFIKNVNSSFIGTKLEEYLRSADIRQLVIVGLTTDHCVSTTTRMAENLGVVDRWTSEASGSHRDKGSIILVGDAVATFAKGGFDAETVHDVNLASLRDEFAEVRDTNEVLRDVLGVTI